MIEHYSSSLCCIEQDFEETVVHDLPPNPYQLGAAVLSISKLGINEGKSMRLLKCISRKGSMKEVAFPVFLFN